MAMEDAKCADSPHVIFRKGLFDGMDARTLVRIIGLEVIVFLFAVASAWMVENGRRNTSFHHGLEFAKMPGVYRARSATVFSADRRRHACDFAAYAQCAHYARRGESDVRTADVAPGQKEIVAVSRV